jgi:hypothetical protein
VHGDAAPAGIKMLARLGAMERECGLDAESREHLALAQELCARYLPSDHPLARQAAALAAAAPAGRHVCGQVEKSSAPNDVPGLTTAGALGGRPTPFPRRPTVPDTGDGPPPGDPFRMPPDNRPTDPNGTVYQQPLYLADVHQAPGDLTGRHARADTPPPMPGHRAPDYGPDGRPQPIGTAPTGTLALPPNSERRLPARIDRPGPRRRQPFLLAAVLVAGVAAAAAVVALTLPDANGAVGPTPSVAATPGATGPGTAGPSARPSAAVSSAAPANPPAADPGAPRNVRLTDRRDSVSLQWAYPSDSEGPVLVSGGRTGQRPRAFQQLPAGTTDYVVYGLNEQQNYCFTVAVAYSTDRIATSAPVCTKR